MTPPSPPHTAGKTQAQINLICASPTIVLTDRQAEQIGGYAHARPNQDE